MEAESSSLNSQQPVIGPCPDPKEASQQQHTLPLYNPFQYYPGTFPLKGYCHLECDTM
jgi:hypothetical protein